MVMKMLYGNFAENDIWAGKYYCPECGKQMDFYLARVYYRVKLFRGATIFSRFKKRVCICEKCGSCKVLDRAEYNEMHTEAVARARRGEFPARIIARDFSPRSIKLYRKLAVSSLACALALLCALTAFGAFSGGNAVYVIIAALLTLLCGYIGVKYTRRLQDAVMKKAIFDYFGKSKEKQE